MLRFRISGLILLVLLLVAAEALAAGAKVDVRNAREKNGTMTAPSNRGTAVLTIDPKLQSDVETLLEKARAPESAAVVIDVKTGRILAWASHDPKRGRDLVARPIGPPASLFKVATAAALIEDAKVPSGATQCYVGGARSVHLSGLRKRAGKGVSCSTFGTSLGYSRNMVMAGLAVRHLKPQALRDTARELGLTGPIPINVDVPSSSPRISKDREGLARAAAGFGGGRLSVLSAGYMMTVIANRGARPSLALVDSFLLPNGKRKTARTVSPGKARAMKQSTARRLTQMLELTVREGTAAKAFRDNKGNRFLGTRSGAGKTGTLSGSNPRRLYSWYAGFAPAYRPRVVVAVMLANDVKWWRKSNEVARDVLRAYFANKNFRGITHPLRRRAGSKRK